MTVAGRFPQYSVMYLRYVGFNFTTRRCRPQRIRSQLSKHQHPDQPGLLVPRSSSTRVPSACDLMPYSEGEEADQRHKSGQEQYRAVAAPGGLADVPNYVGPHETSEVADGVNQRNARRSGRAAEERRWEGPKRTQAAIDAH